MSDTESPRDLAAAIERNGAPTSQRNRSIAGHRALRAAMHEAMRGDGSGIDELVFAETERDEARLIASAFGQRAHVAYEQGDVAEAERLVAEVLDAYSDRVEPPARVDPAAGITDPRELARLVPRH